MTSPTMTREEVLAVIENIRLLAKPHMVISDHEQYVRAYKAVTALYDENAELLEGCARICERMKCDDTDWDTSYWNQAMDRCAFAIRKQKQAEPPKENSNG